MILINLLPHREAARKRKREAFYTSLGMSALLGGLIAGGIFAWYAAQIAHQQGKNLVLQTEIKRLEGQIKEISTLQQEIAALRARQQAVEDLQADRNMPVHLLNEIVRQLPDGVCAKDIMLHLLAQPMIRAGDGVGKVFEFTGSTIAGLSTDERATLTNMTAELGGLTGIALPDAETVRFLKERRGIDFSIEPWMTSDPGAAYAAQILIDCTALAPMVAAPGDPGNGIALDNLPSRVRVDIAYGGSCTAGKREDFDRYHEVLAWGLAHGLRVAPGVQLYLQYGTTAVRDYCRTRGYDQTFQAMGARMLQPSCGACANCGPGSSADASQVTVSAINRNFPGRSGPGQVWLASPATVMASALAGELVSFGKLKLLEKRGPSA